MFIVFTVRLYRPCLPANLGALTQLISTPNHIHW